MLLCLTGQDCNAVRGRCSETDDTTLYVANQGVTMKLRFGGKAVPT
jgi:hypothetical protein